MNAGWPYAEFTARTGFDLRTDWRADLDKLVQRGWGEDLPDRFRLTRAGLRFADAAGAELLRPEARVP